MQQNLQIAIVSPPYWRTILVNKGQVYWTIKSWTKKILKILAQKCPIPNYDKISNEAIKLGIFISTITCMFSKTRILHNLHLHHTPVSSTSVNIKF